MKQACNAAMPMACTVGELLAKKQQEDNSKDNICYLENICGAEGPFIS